MWGTATGVSVLSANGPSRPALRVMGTSVWLPGDDEVPRHTVVLALADLEGAYLVHTPKGPDSFVSTYKIFEM